MDGSIYLDNAATTRLHPAVRDAMEPFFGDVFGNPSSLHRAGRAARRAVEQARSDVADALGAEPDEIVFTGGGTEANVLALMGIWRRAEKPGFVTSAIEHHAVLNAVSLIEEYGCDPRLAAPGEDGVLTVDRVLAQVDDRTGLASVMWVNNETGAIQPIVELAQELSERGILLHTDAVQAIGELAIDLRRVPVAALTVSAHKIHGPKGVGVLFLRRGTPFSPLVQGGGQERNRRGGTENVAAIAGCAKAVILAAKQREERVSALGGLRVRFCQVLSRELDGVRFHAETNAVSHIVNVAFEGVLAETLLIDLDLQGIAASSGSACTSGSRQVSHVLTAMGISEAEARSSVRFSFAVDNTLSQVEDAARIVADSVKRLRRL